MGLKIWELVEMQVWLVMDGWGRMGMFVVVMVNSWWVFGKGIVMYGYVGRKSCKNYVFVLVFLTDEYLGVYGCWFYIDPGGEGRFDSVVRWDYAKCGWLLDYMLLIRSLLEIQEVEELKIQECFYVCFFAGTWMDAMLLVIVCFLIVLIWMCRIVVCLGRSRILLIHFVRLAALGVVYSLGFMSRESKPL
ncbi:hypothetical protein HanIR_Chr05g0225171 [Helianthus annuus]|nr:hypothetical protein HanIR_Chr05g0225171 [Helianthus annuus]